MKQLKPLIKNFVQTNTGEAVLINKSLTKGLSIRGYNEDDFQKLNLVRFGMVLLMIVVGCLVYDETVNTLRTT